MESPCTRHSGRLALPRRIKNTPRKAIFYCYKLPDALPNYKGDGVAQTKPIMGFKVEHSKIKKKKSQLILKINMILKPNHNYNIECFRCLIMGHIAF